VTIINFPSQQADSPFYEDIITEGYHIFSLKNAKIPDYYPDEFLDDQGISIKDLKVGDTITVRVFFRVDDGEDISADGGYMDLEVEEILHDKVTAVILTELPEEFPLEAGDSIEVFEEEILYRNKVTDH
jgi:hypothetical protein